MCRTQLLSLSRMLPSSEAIVSPEISVVWGRVTLGYEQLHVFDQNHTISDLPMTGIAVASRRSYRDRTGRAHRDVPDERLACRRIIEPSLLGALWGLVDDHVVPDFEDRFDIGVWPQDTVQFQMGSMERTMSARCCVYGGSNRGNEIITSSLRLRQCTE